MTATTSDMRLVVAGAAGRMGRVLIKTIGDAPGVILSGALERKGAAGVGQDAGVLAGIAAAGVSITDDAERALAGADGILDFSSPQASLSLAELAARAGLVHVVGTTGLSDSDLSRLESAGRKARIVQSGNMSLGVNLLAALVRRVAKSLGEDFDIEILEMHHRMKVDAPSGTALLLGDAAAAGRAISLKDRSVRSRDGRTGARKPGDIGFAALRGGTVVGEHSVIFAGPSERLELNHRVEDRAIFAHGAIKAALWARDKPPGLYSMADVLGLAEG